ncbi:MAG: hypothetical protein ACRD7E_17170 [Bryobacteraceae bacterium]
MIVAVSMSETPPFAVRLDLSVHDMSARLFPSGWRDPRTIALIEFLRRSRALTAQQGFPLDRVVAG